jgi:hypothetical protein
MRDLKKKPLQIYLREDQIEALRIVSERRGESLASLIREGVDLLLEKLPTSEDPLLDIVGLYDSEPEDLVEKHDEYLEKLLEKEGDHEP